MMTICWNGHKFEYLQDQVICDQCGEYGQHSGVRRFAPGEKEAINNMLKEAQERHLPEVRYRQGYQDGFIAGVAAEELRNK